MSGNVHFLGEKPAFIGEPNDTLVKMLGDMLDKAKSGQLQTLLGVGITSDGGVLSIFTNAAHNEYFLHLGALEALKSEFMKREQDDG